MSDPYVLAVDPGQTTGWAVYPLSEAHRPWAEEAAHVEFLDRVVPWIDQSSGGSVEVVVERFDIGGGTVRKSRGAELWSPEQIGVLRHHARWVDAPFTLQGASDAKALMTDKRLRDLEWYVRGRGHANDALRHLGLYLARRHQAVFQRLLTTHRVAE